MTHHVGFGKPPTRVTPAKSLEELRERVEALRRDRGTARHPNVNEASLRQQGELNAFDMVLREIDGDPDE